MTTTAEAVMSDKDVDTVPTFESNDLVTVAALKCCGHTPNGIVYDTEERSTYWVYDETPELLASVANFALGRLRVEPQKFNSSYVGMKEEMFQFMRAEGVSPRGRH